METQEKHISQKLSVLSLEEIDFQIHMIEKDIALHSQKLFQAQGALLMMRDLLNSYRWKRRKPVDASHRPTGQ